MTYASTRSLGQRSSSGTAPAASSGRPQYVIVLGDGQRTPAPWSNVVSNPAFGFVVTESGGRHVVREQQRDRLTPWSNDAVSDPVSEAFFLRDDDTGVAGHRRRPRCDRRTPYTVRHGQGYTVFEHCAEGSRQSSRCSCPLRTR
ncbi:MAG: hypothetical protein IPF82_16330 [Blastocatellia bacterium]|nr:hypothetical protein [Blastocatellia bacterium]